MVQQILQYGGYALEASLVILVLASRRRRRLIVFAGYLGLLLFADGFARPYVLHRFGLASPQYGYFYWITDVLLTLGAFGLVCGLFRRACAYRPQLWDSLRALLIFVFVLVVGISAVSLSEHYKNLFSIFIVEFQQNLYFTCLVLNTLLYLLMQQIECADEELNLLVCGLGMQFAGPAANFALMFLTRGHAFAGALLPYISPLCTLGMLSTWLYAVTRVPQPATRLAGREMATEAASLSTSEV